MAKNTRMNTITSKIPPRQSSKWLLKPPWRGKPFWQATIAIPIPSERAESKKEKIYRVQWNPTSIQTTALLLAWRPPWVGQRRKQAKLIRSSRIFLSMEPTSTSHTTTTRVSNIQALKHILPSNDILTLKQTSWLTLTKIHMMQDGTWHIQWKKWRRRRAAALTWPPSSWWLRFPYTPYSKDWP